MSTKPLEVAREALSGREAWLVGGAVRDRLLGRPTDDVDITLAGDPRQAARTIARAGGGTAFELSGAFGAWRVVGPGHGWHVDLVTLQGDIDADLAARDFTINAMAEPLAGGDLLDPHGGRADLEARLVRMVSTTAMADDPLRTLRAVRLVTELGFELDPATAASIAEHAPSIDRVAPERVFGELKRVVTADRARQGLALMEAHGLIDAVLPELAALRGVEQNEFHHADVLGHTLEVLDAVAALERGDLGDNVADLLDEPLADELTRGGAMRFAALLHDAAKPETRGVRPDGRVTFIGHDEVGARLVARRAAPPARVTAHDRLRGGAHAAPPAARVPRPRQPLDRREVWRYLRATAPWTDDVTIFTVADRLATRGRNAEEAITAHVALARDMLAAAPPPTEPLIRGDDLARELGIVPGPRLGELLAQLEEDRYAGAIATRQEAIARARHLIKALDRACEGE